MQGKGDKQEQTKLALEKQVEASLWIQFFALLSEAIAVTKLYELEEQRPGSHDIVTGIWIQVIGQLIEAIGVTQQSLAKDNKTVLAGQRTAINGDWLQSMGAAVEATGGERFIRDEIARDSEGFIP